MPNIRRNILYNTIEIILNTTNLKAGLSADVVTKWDKCLTFSYKGV